MDIRLSTLQWARLAPHVLPHVFSTLDNFHAFGVCDTLCTPLEIVCLRCGKKTCYIPCYEWGCRTAQANGLSPAVKNGGTLPYRVSARCKTCEQTYRIQYEKTTFCVSGGIYCRKKKKMTHFFSGPAASRCSKACLYKVSGENSKNWLRRTNIKSNLTPKIEYLVHTKTK